MQSVNLEAYNLTDINCNDAVVYANVWTTERGQKRGVPGSVGEHDSVPINFGPYHVSPGVPMIVNVGLEGQYNEGTQICAQFYRQLPTTSKKRRYGYGGTDLNNPLTDVVCATIHR